MLPIRLLVDQANIDLSLEVMVDYIGMVETAEPKCQIAAYKHNGRCRLHGGLSTGARTPEGLQRISEANLKHGRQTKDKLAAQRHAAKVGRRVLGELKQLEGRLVDAGLMPDV